MANNSTARFGHQTKAAAIREGRKWRARQDQDTQDRSCENGFCDIRFGQVCICDKRWAELPD